MATNIDYVLLDFGFYFDRSTATMSVTGHSLGGGLVPAELMTVAELPLLGTGKIDHPAVRLLVEGRAESPVGA